MIAVVCVAVIAAIIFIELRQSIQQEAEHHHWSEFTRTNNARARGRVR